MRAHLAVVTATLVLFAALVSAQARQLSGTAKDKSGAILPGVTITLEGPALDAARTTTTDRHGEFVFKGLPPGEAYTVTFSLVGFRAVVEKNVTIGGDNDVIADAVMTVGSIPDPPPVTVPSQFGIVLISPQ
jgi:hypothetical protein